MSNFYDVNDLTMIGLAIIAAVFIGRYWQHKVSKEKLAKKENELDVLAKARELNLDNEYESKREELKEKEKAFYKECVQKRTQIDIEAAESKSRCKHYFEKAVEYAYNFQDEITGQHKTAKGDIQKILDDSYRFKRKVLLASITLKNHVRKFEEIKKEREIYKSLLADKEFFSLKDNSDWNAVEKEYRNKVNLLQAAQDEKEAQDEIKRQMREERQRAEELERQQQEAEEKEQMLAEKKRAVEKALLEASEEHKQELEAQRTKLEQEIEDVHKKYERAKSMAQMTKQGHVYVISNIGAFGNDVFKIGMTRRLEPMDRVNELSNASVPFEFDVHAMIICDDAPALEKALHTELHNHRLNKINHRKEFFRTDIKRIIECVNKNHGEVEYVADPVALQYNRSLEMQA
ncbi:hypothetical protein D3C79_312500 [compost metagenome]